ncbi:MAG: hypothetical protein ACRDRS_13685 [Pseudonocardiaceae bacterium]
MSEGPPRPLLYLVVCAAPPARHINELVELLHQAGWRICVIPTQRAAAHPEFGRNLKKLAKWGVNVLPNEVIRVRAEEQDTETGGDDKPAPRFAWWPVMEAVARTQ